jgi:FkbM family methyltransferase
MLLDTNDLVQLRIAVQGEWEPGTWRAISEHIGPGKVFVDVGAHVGYFSLKAAKAVGPQGRVLAVEPNPETLKVLRANVEANRDAMITVYPVACSESDGFLDLFAAARANTGASSLSKANAMHYGPVVNSYHVPTRRLDDLVRDSGVTRVDFVKIDVEGAELLVLKGAVATLDKFHPVLTIEMEPEQLKSMGATTDDVKQLLSAHGYALRHTYGSENNNSEFAYTGAAQPASK